MLDAACGTGKYFAFFEEVGYKITGFDQSPNMLQIAAKKNKTIKLHRATLENFVTSNWYDGNYNVVTCIDALEWLPLKNWPIVIGNFKKALSPSGIIYLNVELPGERERNLLLKNSKSGEYHGQILLDGRKFYFPLRNQMLDWVGSAGLKILFSSSGAGYDHYILQLQQQ